MVKQHRQQQSGTDPAPGPSGTLRAGTYRSSLTVDGTERTYRVHVPASAAGRSGLPVVIGLHGGGGNGEQFEEQSQLSVAADQFGFVAVYPDGSGRTQLLTWNAGNCCAYARDHDIDDIKFMSVLLDSLPAAYHTDPTRVYVTGLSNGAMLTYRVGCELADRVTAIAPVAGAVNVDNCQPSRPLPVIVVHGTADQMVPYNGGPPTRSIPGSGNWNNRSVAQSLAYFTSRDNCPESPVQTVDGAVTHSVYGPCAGGTEVSLYTVEGGGHAWPGGMKSRDAADDPPPAPNTNAVLWSFFSRFAR